MDEYNFVKKEDIDKSPVFGEDCESLFEAIKNDNLIIFIGAGVSRLAGCLGWEEIAEEIVKKSRQEGFLTYAEEEVLLKEIMNPRKIISICYKIFCKQNIEKLFFDLLIKSTEIVKKGYLDIFRKVLDLKARAYITTNIDDGLIQFNPLATGQNIYDCTSQEFNIFIDNDLLVRDGDIFFLHGMRETIKDVIFTIDRYLKFYKENSYVNRFLKEKIFTEDNVILFIGYGLSEWEILEHMFRHQHKSSDSSIAVKRYLLIPLYTSEYIKFRLDSIFYDFFDLIPIPYFIDYEGYYKLSGSLDKLIKKINNYQPTASEVFNKIDKVIDNNE